MTHEYALSRVKDALEKSGGNHLKAQRLILTWVEKDHTLLFGLITPHLQGIISHAVNHVEQPVKKKAPQKIALNDAEAGEFGAAIMGSLRNGSAGFGEAMPRNIGKPGKTSQKHIDAINSLVKAGAKTSGGTKKK